MAPTQGRSRVTPEQAAIAQASFSTDLEGQHLFSPVDLSLDALFTGFHTLALRHTAHHGFRTYDLLHVSSALVLECQMFWSFDEKARKLARLEGLQLNAR